RPLSPRGKAYPSQESRVLPLGLHSWLATLRAGACSAERERVDLRSMALRLPRPNRGSALDVAGGRAAFGRRTARAVGHRYRARGKHRVGGAPYHGSAPRPGHQSAIAAALGFPPPHAATESGVL